MLLQLKHNNGILSRIKHRPLLRQRLFTFVANNVDGTPWRDRRNETLE